MLRNVVMVKLKPEHDPVWAAEMRAKFAALDCPGTVSYTIGPDAGLREGNWTYAIVADFTDVAAYQGYDQDAEHNRLRAELAPMVEQISRVQFEI
ncbi:Dabb family protein [Pseudonocardiaceae bacterium YIM PH 21723]|nr:Dabb family protein [Pseudonocardiaceae bacterium YIM PH 21723]